MFPIILFSAIIQSVHSNWNPTCDPCRCEEISDLRLRISNCSSSGLQTFPSVIPDTVDIVDISNNVLISVKSSDFENLLYLRTLKGIEALEFSENAFLHLQELQSLTIVFHQTQIPENIFQSLKLHHLYIDARSVISFPKTLLKSGSINLVNLVIIAPKLEVLDNNFFQGLTQLKILRIEAQNLNTLPVDLFHESDPHLSSLMPSNLIEISIVGVQYIPSRIFWNQLSLLRLLLHGIGNLPSGLFDNAGTLNYLDLSTSTVQEVSPNWFSALRSLRYLSLKNTSLSVITENTFSGLDSLASLDLSHNILKTLANFTFKHFKNTLKFLNASNNHIETLGVHSFQGMFSLETLDLSHNQIAYLSSSTFVDLQRLTYLYLQSNELSYIPDYILQHQRNLQKVTLASNKLMTLPPALLENARNLLKIDFSNNSIATFPGSFFSNVRYLQYLILSNNPLHCDCHLTTLTFIFRSRTTITGTCSTPSHLKGLSVTYALSIPHCEENDSEQTEDDDDIPVNSTVLEDTELVHTTVVDETTLVYTTVLDDTKYVHTKGVYKTKFSQQSSEVYKIKFSPSYDAERMSSISSMSDTATVTNMISGTQYGEFSHRSMNFLYHITHVDSVTETIGASNDYISTYTSSINPNTKYISVQTPYLVDSRNKHSTLDSDNVLIVYYTASISHSESNTDILKIHSSPTTHLNSKLISQLESNYGTHIVESDYQSVIRLDPSNIAMVKYDKLVGRSSVQSTQSIEFMLLTSDSTPLFESISQQEMSSSVIVKSNINIFVNPNIGKGRGEEISSWSGINAFYIATSVIAVCFIAGVAVVIKRYRAYIRGRSYVVTQQTERSTES